MSGSKQLISEQFASPQSEQSPTPNRITQATQITPTTKLIFLTGATQIKRIGTLVAATTDPVVPKHIDPVQDGYHELVLIPDTGSTLDTTGDSNFSNAVVLTANVPNMLFYDPVTKLYYGFAGNLT
jgi:hypothetical protein